MPANYFLKIEGIQGESTTLNHKDEIEVLAWNWSETQPSIAIVGGATPGRVQMHPFHVIAKSSSASPKLFLACAGGQHIPMAVFAAVKVISAQVQDYMTWKFSDVIVTSYQVGADKDETISTDEFNLEFSRVVLEYKPLKSDGSLGSPIMAEWDLRSPKPV
ncbi:MAG TPA: type VI secretion system tube protein Hcp [Anaerolineaceae bacterium]|nr:type VI secretion system tube protein Hcp [Anaerolineaceae bacterium]